MKSIHRLWTFGLTSPVIYLIVCVAVQRFVFSRRTYSGFSPLPAEIYHWVVVALVAVAAGAIPIVYWLKVRWAAKAPDSNDEEAWVTETRRGRRFLALFMISDTIALLGLILFLIQGRMMEMMIFGILGLLNYAASCPGKRE